MSAKHILKVLLRLGRKHSTKILAGMAIATEAISLWLMSKEAPIAQQKIKALDANATWWEKVKTGGPIYLPALFMFLMSSGCIIGGYIVGEAKFMAMAGVASATEATLRKYEQKMIETVGEDKAQEMHAEVTKELAREKPLTNAEVVYTTHGGELFYDKLSGRYFTSSEEFIRNAVSKVNNAIYDDMWASVNDFYSFLDIPEVKLGDYSGWNSDNLLGVSFYGDRTPEGKYYGVIVYYADPILYNGRPPERIHA